MTRFKNSCYENGIELQHCLYRGADKSLARPTSRCILFDGENILFHASLAIYIYSTNIPPIMIIYRIHEHQNLLSLSIVSFLISTPVNGDFTYGLSNSEASEEG
jgi:hypothetical protein